MKPAVAVLVKNEAFWLPYTLVQTEGHFDRYVIYDVGSTDGTKEIIEWWVERMKDKAEIFTRLLPHCPPEVQGTFRNSMALEGDRPVYFMLDGDELYSERDLKQISHAAGILSFINKENSRIKYGVIQRTEVTGDLMYAYKERRTHHRLYVRDAWFEGTHPGERPRYQPNDKNGSNFPDIMCWHMHNTLRTSDETDTPGRIKRKSQRSYHPGNEKEPLGLRLLDTLPILRKPIENFPVNPMLQLLQEDYVKSQST